MKDGLFLMTGRTRECEKYRGPGTRVIDLEDKLALPGFNDSHVHFFDGGYYLMGVDLRQARNERDLTEKLAQYAAGLQKEEWILGGNWDHEAWPSRKYPSKELIDPVTPNHPVFVHRLDTHIALCNSTALKLAGINKKTADPPGGEIERDASTGEPTGIIKDNAIKLVKKVVPPLSPKQRKMAIRTALTHAASLGVTSIQDNSSPEDFDIYRQLAKDNELTVRINAWATEEHGQVLEGGAHYLTNGSPVLKTGTIKIFVDGSLGAGTALLFEPYSDAPSSCGIAIYSEKELYEKICALDRSGHQIAAHAIGDRAVNWALNAFEQAAAENGFRRARHRVEHAQLVMPRDIERFRQHNILASIEPVHCIDDMRWLEGRIGDRVRFAHPFQSFIREGVKLLFGTDWAVEPLNPLLNIYAAVTREFPEGGPRGGWFPAEKMNLSSAIEAYTITSAYGEFQEDVKGSIEAGKVADLIVLDRNLFEHDYGNILKTKVDMTIFNGKIIYPGNFN